jgi:hypothetical protein
LCCDQSPASFVLNVIFDAKLRQLIQRPRELLAVPEVTAHEINTARPRPKRRQSRLSLVLVTIDFGKQAAWTAAPEFFVKVSLE